MDARELRIGNWVKEISTGKYRQVLMIGWDTIYTGLSNDCPNDYEPIHLTPEILEKAGFEYPNTWRVYTLKDRSFSIDLNYADTRIWSKNSTDHIYIPKIKYLHQLQNLYFALTQTDLPINL